MQPRSREFARGIAFYGKDLALWLLRGPGTPHARLRHARTRLEQALVAEIERRRREHRTADDILSMLMRAEDEDGWHFSNRQLVDHLLTLLFAGHDTTSTTVALLLFELARHPNWRSKVVAELDQAVAAGLPGEEQLFGGLPVLEQILDETLRLYPAVPAGQRRSIAEFEFAGRRVPAGIHVQYSPWASHRLAEVFPNPHSFRPERMAREAKANFPKGAYVPFGGGRRTCVGKRFGYLEAKVVASRVLQRFVLEVTPKSSAQMKWSATLRPKGRLLMRIAAR